MANCCAEEATFQAMGFGGFVLGWIPFFRKQMREQTRVALTKYVANKH